MKNLFMTLTVAGILAATAGAAEPAKHLFILSGQSNMVRMDPDESFTPAVQEEFGENNVIVVKDAKGSQSILRWYKEWESAEGTRPESTGDLYDRLLKKVQTVIEGEQIQTVTFVWMQGERDARTEQSSVYAASLEGLLDQLRDDLNREDIFLVIGRLNDFDMENERWPHWTLMREVQVATAEAAPHRAWVDSDDINGDDDGLHLPPENYVILGERFAAKAIKLINEASKK